MRSDEKGGIVKLIRLLPIILVVLVATSSTQAAEIHVGSWNIEHLGFPQSRSGNARDVAQSAEDLAERILSSNVDVLALQEIGDNDGNDGTRRNKTLDVVMDILSEEPGHDWAYRIFENRGPNDSTQLCGVAWNKEKVTRIGRPLKVPATDTTPQFFEWDRHPHATKFSTGPGKTDFVVISLHMKSGSSTNNRNQRENEADSLIVALADVRQSFSDQDIILIGDMNVNNTNEQALQKLTAAGFTDLLTVPTTVALGNQPFDHALVPTNQSEFNNSQQTVMSVQGTAERQQYRRLLSDHFLIVMTLTAGADDD